MFYDIQVLVKLKHFSPEKDYYISIQKDDFIVNLN